MAQDKNFHVPMLINNYNPRSHITASFCLYLGTKPTEEEIDSFIHTAHLALTFGSFFYLSSLEPFLRSELMPSVTMGNYGGGILAKLQSQ